VALRALKFFPLISNKNPQKCHNSTTIEGKEKNWDSFGIFDVFGQKKTSRHIKESPILSGTLCMWSSQEGGSG